MPDRLLQRLTCQLPKRYYVCINIVKHLLYTSLPSLDKRRIRQRFMSCRHLPCESAIFATQFLYRKQWPGIQMTMQATINAYVLDGN